MAAPTRTPRQRGSEEALEGTGGGRLDAVWIELLAKLLGVTRGGFSRAHFEDCGALLAETLHTWGVGRRLMR